jgi:hypothetical protein
MATNKKLPPSVLFETDSPVKDEIPGLLDFYATSAMGGFISATGLPIAAEADAFCDYIALLSYKQAKAMYAEKYREQIKH